MLDPEYLLRISEGGEAIAESLHADIIKQIVERIALRLSRGDDYRLTAQDKWQIEVLMESGYLREDIEKELVKYTGLMQKEIAEAMEDAGVKSLDYDNAVYEAAGLSPEPLVKSPHLIRLLQRAYEATMGEWLNYTRTTADACQQAFVNACDTAYNQVYSGALGYAQAYAEAIDNIAKEGVAVVKYSKINPATGEEHVHVDTIETATLRCIRTGVSQATAQITDARMEEMDWDIILVSSHLGARVTDADDFTNHYWWQGKFYSKSGKDSRFPAFSVCGQGHVQGIHGANCRHHHGPGDGEFNPYEHFDSEENQKEYELQQKQRSMERGIRKTKQRVMGLQGGVENAQTPETKAAAEEVYQRAAARLQRQNEAYTEFCKENDLKPLSERLAVAKWDRSQAAKARAAAKKHTKEKENREKNLHFIENDAKIKAASGLPKKLLGLPDEQLKHTVKVDVWPAKKGDFEFHAVAPKLSEMKSIEVMAGFGTSTPIRDVRRLYETYNLDAEKWQKKSGTAYGKSYHYVIHWYENDGFVPQDEIKLKGMKKNK